MEESLLLPCAATMGVAVAPVLELRGAIPFGLALGLPVWLTYAVAVIGNMIPVPAIILFTRAILRWLRKFPRWNEAVTRLVKRAHLKGRMVRRYRLPGLILLVAIPFPGTGAWTGALVASLFDIRIQTALPAIFLGVLIAGGLVTAACLGGISLWGM